MQAAALYTQAGDYQKTARFYYQKAEDTYYQANNWAAYDDWRRARDQWDYFYSRNVRPICINPLPHWWRPRFTLVALRRGVSDRMDPFGCPWLLLVTYWNASRNDAPAAVTETQETLARTGKKLPSMPLVFLQSMAQLFSNVNPDSDTFPPPFHRGKSVAGVFDCEEKTRVDWGLGWNKVIAKTKKSVVMLMCLTRATPDCSFEHKRSRERF